MLYWVVYLSNLSIYLTTYPFFLNEAQPKFTLFSMKKFGIGCRVRMKKYTSIFFFFLSFFFCGAAAYQSVWKDTVEIYVSIYLYIRVFEKREGMTLFELELSINRFIYLASNRSNESYCRNNCKQITKYIVCIYRCYYSFDMLDVLLILHLTFHFEFL